MMKDVQRHNQRICTYLTEKELAILYTKIKALPGPPVSVAAYLRRLIQADILPKRS